VVELWPVDRWGYPDAWRVAAGRAVVLAWAASPGFASIHADIATGVSATDEQIVDDLLKFLKAAGF
jgi:hypothetical protein